MSEYKRNAFLVHAVTGLSLVVVGVVFYVSVFGVFSDSYLRVGMLLIGGLLLILYAAGRSGSLLDRGLLAGVAICLSLSVYQYFRAAEEIETGLYFLTSTDIWMGFLGLIAVIELTRRSVGLVMAVVAGLLLAYGAFGHLAPGFLRHAGISTEELMTVLWYSFDGVFGRPLATVVSTILIFIVFGALLELLAIDLVLSRLAVVDGAHCEVEDHRLRGIYRCPVDWQAVASATACVSLTDGIRCRLKT